MGSWLGQRSAADGRGSREACGRSQREREKQRKEKRGGKRKPGEKDSLGGRSLPEEEGMRKGVTVKGGISGIIPINYLLIFVLMPFFSFC